MVAVIAQRVLILPVRKKTENHWSPSFAHSDLDRVSQRDEAKPVVARSDGRPISVVDEERWLTEFDRRKAPKAHTGLCGDGVPNEETTRNANEAGRVFSDTDSDEDASTGSDDGLPAGQCRSKRLHLDLAAASVYKRHSRTVPASSRCSFHKD